jgi:hypothetical protein
LLGSFSPQGDRAVASQSGHRQYARFLKSLFAVYYSAVRASRDGRLSAGRPAIVKETAIAHPYDLPPLRRGAGRHGVGRRRQVCAFAE